MDKAAIELQQEINKIDFDGGLAPVSTTGDSTPTGSTTPVEPSTPVKESEKPAVETKPTPKVEGDEPPTPAGKEPITPEKESPEPADDRPAIPDSHYRAALHMGMKPEEIAELYDQSPAIALKAVAKFYEMVNASSKQLGELGQRARQIQAQQTATPTAPAQPNRKDVIMKKLREKYEDDPIIDLVGELIPDQTPVPEVHGFKPQPAVPDPQVEIERQVAVRQQINTFFNNDEMEPYNEFYGESSQAGTWDHLTPGQRANRVEVCNRAQLLLDGAALSGMQLNTVEALERAHLEVAAPMAAEVTRARIVKSVQKRAAGVTLAPSGSRTLERTGDTYNKTQAVEEMKAELTKVFGG